MKEKTKDTSEEFVVELVVQAENGIHLGPAALLSKYAQKRKDLNIFFRRENNKVPAASVMSILTLELTKGAAIEVIFSKKDEAGLCYIRSVLNGEKEQ